MASFGILVGGGPAPGINGVIGAAATQAARHGARVMGCLEGFRWLMEGDSSHVRELRPEEVARIHLQGGSILRTSRANPTKRPELLANVVKALDGLGVDHLVTIGGDDTAFSAKRVSDEAAGRIRVAHVPKTIDNDLPLPEGVPTFGFDTARHHAALVIENIVEDCQTTSRWFFVVVMGRKAGHLALGAGKAAGATLTLIAEEFSSDPIRLDDIVRTIEGSIVKRRSQGRPDGVVVLAEGLGERIDPSDLEVLKDVERDEHGHIRLAEVPLGRVLRHAVRDSLAARGIQLAAGEKDVGYELRCGKPSAFDRDYTRDLGVGAVCTLLEGKRDVLITRQFEQIVPIPFDELMDPETGRTRVRLVNPQSDSFRAARALQTRVEQEDLEDPEQLAALAHAAQLPAEAVRRRYAPLC